MKAWLVVLALAGAACHHKTEPSTRPTPDRSPSREGSGPAGVTLARNLTRGSWALVTLHGRPAAPGNRGKPLTVRFAPDGTVTGFGGCNGYTAKYANRAEEIRVTSVAAASGISCTRGMTAERDFLATLGKIDGWRLASGQLELLVAGSPVAVFDPQ
jgi:heat shock protein HslJ